jgi:succinate-semialdehyde dehydrogenase/glutarate-semialdehyde dehydrogenase
MFIGGSVVAETSAPRIDVVNPATEETIGAAPTASATEIEAVLAAAERGFRDWSAIKPFRRALILQRAAALLRERADEIAATATLESGKPLVEAKAEALNAAEHFEWFAGEGRRVYGYTVDGRLPESRIRVEFSPVGVVLALTPWNFPVSMGARKIAMALAAGCSVILRPNELVPASASLLVRACHEAGLPDGAVNMVVGPPEASVAPLMAAAAVRKVSFTGSTPVGKLLIRQSAETVKRITMELGGHAPVIVMPDVNVEKVATAAAKAKFRNSGQVCVSPSRFFVHESIAKEFSAKIVSVAKAQRLGDGFDPAVDMGPLITAKHREKAEALVEDARAKGAKVTAGGGRPNGFNRGYFFEPTVLQDVPPSARILTDEPFAPIAPIMPFSRVDEAIERSNALEYGLSAYVFTHSLADANVIADRLEVGICGVNTFAAGLPELPFGGVKQSGFGREGGAEGIWEFMNPKMIHAVIA